MSASADAALIATAGICQPRPATMPDSRIYVDRARWPLVRIRFPAVVDDHEFARYLAALTRLTARRAPYATLTDLAAMTTPLTAAQRAEFDRWMERAEGVLAPFAAGNAIVAPSPLARAIAHTVYWHWRTPPRHRVFATITQAERWCAARLSRALARPPKKPPREPARPTSATSTPALAAVIDLFEEPAFLVDPQGKVLFASRSARAAYPAPHDWLPDALSIDGSESGDRELRVVIVEPDVRLVIVDEGGGLSNLPPSLRKVAQRLRLGDTDKDIAAATGLAVSTVRTYVRRLYARMGVHDRRELMRRRRPS